MTRGGTSPWEVLGKSVFDETALPTKPPDVSWHDYLVMLLHIAAELEHALMVQYLYAAYSLDSDGVPDRNREMVARWRKSILSVAREEMGHFVTVQNVLLLLSAPLNMTRQDFPWDVAYVPFPFMLEPLTLDSVAAYLYAEMPSDEELKQQRKSGNRRYREFLKREKVGAKQAKSQKQDVEDMVKARTAKAGRKPHRVDIIYEKIIKLISCRERIPDSAFRDETFTSQATWDDWGRRYRPAPKMLTAEGDPTPPKHFRSAWAQEARVLVMPVATRTQAVEALQALSEQGEAPHLGADQLDKEHSHFDRFLEIYQEFRSALEGEPRFRPARDVAINPNVRNPADANGYIGNARTQEWARLSNLRYRMLLSYLLHSLRSAMVSVRGEPNLRAMLMHKVFGEMYNIKALSNLLMRMPRYEPKRRGPGPEFAGPPFAMPYDISLPYLERAAWLLHLELAEGSIALCKAILAGGEQEGRAYLNSLIELDRQTVSWIKQVLAGLAPRGH